MKKGSPLRAIAAFIIAFGFPIGFFTYFYIHRAHYDFPPKYYPIGTEQRIVDGETLTDTVFHTLPDFQFISQTGDTITKENVKGKIFVADFFFSTCQTICIDMADQMERVQKFIEDKDDVMILSHTVDPETDSVPVLKAYGDHHEANPKKWLLLTGEKTELYRLAREGYKITATEGDGGINDFIHSNRFTLVDSLFQIRGYYDGTDSVSVDKLFHDIELLQLEKNVLTDKEG